MLDIKLDELHLIHLDTHGWVKVDDYIITKESGNTYYLSKVVNKQWLLDLKAAKETKIIEKEDEQ